MPGGRWKQGGTCFISFNFHLGSVKPGRVKVHSLRILYLTRQVSEEQIRIYNDGLPRAKPGRRWANCAPPYWDSQSRPDVTHSNQGLQGPLLHWDAVPYRPLRHSGVYSIPFPQKTKTYKKVLSLSSSSNHSNFLLEVTFNKQTVLNGKLDKWV